MSKAKKPKKLTLLERSNMPEDWRTAGPERELCQKCGAYQACERPFMPPYVPPGWTGEVLLVGERPGQDEDRNSGRPFTGRAGQALARMLDEAGYDAQAVALTNAVRCADPANAEPNMEQVRCCRPFLLGVIQELQPKTVLGSGTVAAKALTNNGQANVTSLRGRVVDVPGLTIPPGQAPALTAGEPPGEDEEVNG